MCLRIGPVAVTKTAGGPSHSIDSRKFHVVLYCTFFLACYLHVFCFLFTFVLYTFLFVLRFFLD